jgi:putative aldouronate transport system permease protein
MKRVSVPKLLNYTLVFIFAGLCVLPMLLVLAISLSSNDSIRTYGYQLIPKEFSFEA